MPEPQHLWERYLQAVQRFGSPEEVDQLLRKIGDPKEAMDRHAKVEKILERHERLRWVFAIVKEVSAWIVGVGAAIVMIYAGYTFLSTTARRADAPPPPFEAAE